MAQGHDREAAKRALANIRRQAGRAALGDRLPEDRRASRGVLVSIGLADPPPSEDDEDDEEEEIPT